MIQTGTREIGGYSYSVSQLGAGEGRRILIKLTKMLGPSLGHLLAIADGKLDQSIAGALYELSSNVSDGDFTDLCRTFGERTEVEIDGKPHKLDLQMQELHFAGAYGDLLKWLGFCLELNYKDFFAALREINPKSESPQKG
jgi:hypothetical protein